jgi:hypothetical protein
MNCSFDANFIKISPMGSELMIYNTADGKASVALYARDGDVWMNQQQLAELFDTSKQNVGQHIKSILIEKELDHKSVVKNYFTTAADGKQYEVTFYSLAMILAIGFRVRSKRGTQFRIWANQNLREYMVKGFVMDDERLKNPDGTLQPDFLFYTGLACDKVAKVGNVQAAFVILMFATNKAIMHRPCAIHSYLFSL